VFFIPDVSNFVSIQSLVLTAADRFGAVVFPLSSPLFSSKLCFVLILASWVVAMAFHSTYLFVLKLVEDGGRLFCTLQWSDAFGESSSYANFIIAGFVVFFYIPMALLTILYSIIVIKLKLHKTPGEQTDKGVQQHAKRERNVLKMAVAIVLGFVLCWLPWSIIIFLDLRDIRLPCGISDIVWFVVELMSFLNSAVNPCICFTFSGNYRRGLKRLLKCSS